MRIPTIVATLTLAATITVTAQVSNAAFGYTLSVPEGFTAYPDGNAQPDVIDCWAEAGQNGLPREFERSIFFGWSPQIASVFTGLTTPRPAPLHATQGAPVTPKRSAPALLYARI